MNQLTPSTVFVVLHEHEISDTNEDVKLIGIYSTKEKAQEAADRLSLQPGFSKTVDGFHIDEYTMDQDHWTEGFVTEWYPIQ